MVVDVSERLMPQLVMVRDVLYACHSKMKDSPRDDERLDPDENRGPSASPRSTSTDPLPSLIIPLKVAFLHERTL